MHESAPHAATIDAAEIAPAAIAAIFTPRPTVATRSPVCAAGATIAAGAAVAAIPACSSIRRRSTGAAAATTTATRAIYGARCTCTSATA